MFEYGESHTKKISDTMQGNYEPAAGVSRFEFGEFSGIAATPEQYFQATMKQKEMQKNFWTWVKNTTPKNYYDIKVKEVISGENANEPAPGDGIVGYTQNGVPIPALAGYKGMYSRFFLVIDFS